jgi:hypothetical protein
MAIGKDLSSDGVADDARLKKIIYYFERSCSQWKVVDIGSTHQKKENMYRHSSCV